MSVAETGWPGWSFCLRNRSFAADIILAPPIRTTAIRPALSRFRTELLLIRHRVPVALRAIAPLHLFFRGIRC
jgi:hypothetical protein